jgi:hypothetical protein
MAHKKGTVHVTDAILIPSVWVSKSTAVKLSELATF